MSAPHDMMSIREVCRFFGGDKPLDPSTIYRMIARGDLPPAVKLGPQVHRWVRSECEYARQALIDRAKGATPAADEVAESVQEGQ